MNQTPAFYRLSQIIGDKKAKIQGLLPISSSSWWQGVREGRYPQPVNLGRRTTAWRANDIHELIEKLSNGQA